MMGFTDEERLAWQALARSPEGWFIRRAFVRLLQRTTTNLDPCALQKHELMRIVAQDFLTAVEDLDAPDDRTVADVTRQLAARARAVRTASGTVGSRRAARRGTDGGAS